METGAEIRKEARCPNLSSPFAVTPFTRHGFIASTARKRTVTRPWRSVKLIPGAEREIPGKNGTRVQSSPLLFLPFFLRATEIYATASRETASSEYLDRCVLVSRSFEDLSFEQSSLPEE